MRLCRRTFFKAELLMTDKPLFDVINLGQIEGLLKDARHENISMIADRSGFWIVSGNAPDLLPKQICELTWK